MKRLWIPCVVCTSLVAVWFVVRHGVASDNEEFASQVDGGVPSPNGRIATFASPGSVSAKKVIVRSQVVDESDDSEDDDDGRSPEEKALAERIDNALDGEDIAAAIACADEALRCGNVEIRQSMVSALGWFGEKALPELTPFLADTDEDVRESAMNEWTVALSAIDDDQEKIGVVELAMGVLSDEDALEEISTEYIGVDEKLAVESLSRIISAGRSEAGVAKAKETYEFVTGDEWVSIEDAARWIAEEYDPPKDQ